MPKIDLFFKTLSMLIVPSIVLNLTLFFTKIVKTIDNSYFYAYIIYNQFLLSFIYLIFL